MKTVFLLCRATWESETLHSDFCTDVEPKLTDSVIHLRKKVLIQIIHQNIPVKECYCQDVMVIN